MIEETDKKEAISPEKLMIDNPSDFQFHAAYLAYAETYDKTTESEARKELNQSIEALKLNQIDYPTFYRNLDQYRAGTSQSQSYGRFYVKTQRKREWRRATQKNERIRRHKK